MSDVDSFLVQHDDPVLLVMPDIELLDILKIMCEVAGDQQAKGKFECQTIKPSNTPCCKANTGQQIKTENVDINDAKSNMPDYFRSVSAEQQKKEQARH